MRGYWAESKRWKALGWVLGVVLSAAPLQAQKLTWLSDAFPAIHDISANGSTVVGYVYVGLVCQPYGCGSAFSAFACGEFSFQCGGLGDKLTCVSDDGAVAAGVHHEVDTYYFCTYSEYYTTFRCTAQGAEDIADNAFPTDISADGSVIVGIARADDHTRVFRWTEAAGFQLLGIDYSGLSAPRVSDDGQVIVGTGLLNDGSRRRVMFRWTEAGGTQILGYLGYEHDGSGITGISADGSVIVGFLQGNRIFRWTEATGIQDLGISGLNVQVSADGSTIAGVYSLPGGRARAFRWTEATGMQDLRIEWRRDPGIGDFVGLSANGSVIVVQASYEGLYYWTEAAGAVNLYDLLCLHGDRRRSSQAEWGRFSYLEARRVSADGRYIVGTGYLGWQNRGGVFRIDMMQPADDHGFPVGDVNYDKVVDDADLMTVLFNFGIQWNRQQLGCIGYEAHTPYYIRSWGYDVEYVDPTSYEEWVSWLEVYSGSSLGSFAQGYSHLDLRSGRKFEAGSMACYRGDCGHIISTKALSKGAAAILHEPDVDNPWYMTGYLAITTPQRRVVINCYDYTDDFGNVIETECPHPKALSDNGSVAVGIWMERSLPWGSWGYLRAFRWTEAGGMQELPTLGGAETHPTALSGDGSVVVGQSQTADGTFHAFRWTETTGMQDLGTLGGSQSGAIRVSKNGAVVIGWAETASGESRLFRWTEATGMQDLGLPAQGTTVRFLSEDGSLMIGHIRTDHSTIIFRWSESAGLQFLGTLGGARAEVTGITWDGSVLVGWSQTASGQTHVFRWTEATGMQDLGPGDRIVISPDGLVMAWSIRGQRVIYWHQGRALSLSELPLLKKQGVHPGTVWGVSSDGRSLLISATDGRSWGDPCFPDGGHGFEGRCLLYITLPFGDANYDGVVDDADLLAVFFNFGSDCR